MAGLILSVHCSGEHGFAKLPCGEIRLEPGLGVVGDAHSGATVQHRSRVRQDPTQPNLRQVHLIHAELFDELAAKGFAITPGAMGENVTTRGIDLLGLPRGARLRLGSEAVVEVTGLRNPCRQIDDNIGVGAMAATVDRASGGTLVRKAGVMAVVIEGGSVRPGEAIAVARLPAERVPLVPV